MNIYIYNYFIKHNYEYIQYGKYITRVDINLWLIRSVLGKLLFNSLRAEFF